MTKKIVDYAKGGAGKKAPYQTEMYRIPAPIKREVQLIAAIVRRLYATAGAESVEVFLSELANATLEVDANIRDYVPCDNRSLPRQQTANQSELPEDKVNAVKAVVDRFRHRRKDTRNWVEANRLIDDLVKTLS